jgi:hypothetical protein
MISCRGRNQLYEFLKVIVQDQNVFKRLGARLEPLLNIKKVIMKNLVWCSSMYYFSQSSRDSSSSSLRRIGYPSGKHVCPKIVFPRKMLNYTAKSLMLWSPSTHLIYSLLLEVWLFESLIEEKDEISVISEQSKVIVTEQKMSKLVQRFHDWECFRLNDTPATLSCIEWFT